MRHDVFDNANLGAAIAFIGSIMAGVDWGQTAGMAATVYSILLIGEKVSRWVGGKKDHGDGGK